MTVKNKLSNNVNHMLFTLLLGALVASVSSAGEVQNGVFHVTAEEAKRVLAERDDVKVLDVRTADEFKQGGIAGAINIDYYAEDFADQLNALDPETTYLVHCRSGVRSGKSVAILKDRGISKLMHLDGGIKAWINSGGKLE